MKYLLILFTLFSSLINLGYSREISFEEVTEYVTKQNYTVNSKALNVYIAKERIHFLRNDLLPKLNFWKIMSLSAVTQMPWMAVGILKDLAPFMVPANWFAWRKAKHSFMAQQEQYYALWANEVMHSRLLYLTIQKDIALMRLLENKLIEYRFIFQLADVRYISGQVESHDFKSIEAQFLSLKEDHRKLKNLVYQEVREFSFAIGLQEDDEGKEEEITLKPVVIPNISNLSQVEFTSILEKSLTMSPEIKQYTHLLESLKWSRRMLKWSFFGMSNYSAGTGSGVYDNIPIQNGLGFSMGPSIAIGRSKQSLIALAKTGTSETIRKQALVYSNEINDLINNFHTTKRQEELNQDSYYEIKDFGLLGRTFPILKYIKHLDESFVSSLRRIGLQYYAMELDEKIKRMTFEPPYKNLPDTLEIANSIGKR